MSDDSYARLRCGCSGSLGGLAGVKSRKPYTARVDAPYTCQRSACGRTFVPGKKGQRFCSDRCRNAENNRAGGERRRNSQPRNCRWCKLSYVPEYGSLRTYYCSLDCRDAAKRLVRAGNTHRRRARKYGCDYMSVNKLEVFERDGWACYLCGRKTPREKRGTQDPDAPELDHFVPLAKGGAHSYENTRCACRSCNHAKGASMPPEIASA